MRNPSLHAFLEAYTWALKEWNECRDELKQAQEVGSATSIEYWQWQCDHEAAHVQTTLINFFNAKRELKEHENA